MTKITQIILFLLVLVHPLPLKAQPIATPEEFRNWLGEDGVGLSDQIIADHLETALRVREQAKEKLSDELWRDYVLDPRIGLGQISLWRGELYRRYKELLDLPPEKRAQELNRSISAAVRELRAPSPIATTPSPLGVIRAGVASPCQHAATLVAAMRSLNLPSRLVWSEPPAGGFPPCFVEVNLSGEWKAVYPAEPDRFGDPRPYLPGLPDHLYTLTPEGVKEITSSYGGKAKVRILVASGSSLLTRLGVYQLSIFGLVEIDKTVAQIENPYPGLTLLAGMDWWETELTAPAHFYLLGTVPVTQKVLMVAAEPLKTYPGTSPIYLMEALPPVEELPREALLEIKVGDPERVLINWKGGMINLPDLARTQHPLVVVIIDPNHPEELELAERVGTRALTLGAKSLILTYPMGLAATTSLLVGQVAQRFQMERAVAQLDGFLPADTPTPLVVVFDNGGRIVLTSQGRGYPLDKLLNRGIELARRKDDSNPN